MNSDFQNTSNDRSPSPCSPASGSQSVAPGSQVGVPIHKENLAATGLAGIWPTTDSRALHSTDSRWKPDNHEAALLDFVETLILDVSKTHPAITERDIAAWLAGVVEEKAGQCEELRAWRKKAALAKEFLEKFPDCTPAKQFLERFKEKFGYELGL